jgi:hypothetical protein
MRQQWNNLQLNKRQKALTLKTLTLKSKIRLHEKMGNLAFAVLANQL